MEGPGRRRVYVCVGLQPICRRSGAQMVKTGVDLWKLLLSCSLFHIMQQDEAHFENAAAV